jgi:hypothetical protein
MTVAELARRADALESASNDRTQTRTLHRIAKTLGAAPEALRAEAIMLQRRFDDARITSDEAKLALVASELNVSPGDLRREVAEVLSRC